MTLTPLLRAVADGGERKRGQPDRDAGGRHAEVPQRPLRGSQGRRHAVVKGAFRTMEEAQQPPAESGRPKLLQGLHGLARSSFLHFVCWTTLLWQASGRAPSILHVKSTRENNVNIPHAYQPLCWLCCGELITAAARCVTEDAQKLPADSARQLLVAGDDFKDPSDLR